MTIFNEISSDINNPKRIFGLDLLRAIAILVVLHTHIIGFLPKEYQIFTIDGVNIFFVLSGFLIGNIFIQSIENTSKVGFDLIRTFWRNRWYRTIPNYYFMLFLLLLIDFDKWIGNGFAYKSYFLFLQNLNWRHPNYFGEAWSLATEEWFYLLLPCIFSIGFFVFKLSRKQAVFFFIIIIGAFSFFIRLYKFTHLQNISLEILHLDFKNQVFTRLDMLSFGVLAAYLKIYKPNLFFYSPIKMLFFGLLLIVFDRAFENVHSISEPKSIFAFYYFVVFFGLKAIPFFLLLPYLYGFKKSQNWFGRIVTFISLISYSLYLTHAEIVIGKILSPLNIFLFKHGFYHHNNIRLTIIFLSYVLITVSLSTLTYCFVEKPFLKLRNMNQ